MSGVPNSRPEGSASRSSAPAAGIEAESRGGAAVRAAPSAADDGGKPAAAKERGAEAGPSFEDALAKVKPAHKEPEADGSLGVQAADPWPRRDGGGGACRRPP